MRACGSSADSDIYSYQHSRAIATTDNMATDTSKQLIKEKDERIRTGEASITRFQREIGLKKRVLVDHGKLLTH